MFARERLTRSGPADEGRRSVGFTLVELLVVVSIIALLIAILLPSLRSAREHAKLAACLANLTGIGKASLTYAADDPGENMIPVVTRISWTTPPERWNGEASRASGRRCPSTTTRIRATERAVTAARPTGR